VGCWWWRPAGCCTRPSPSPVPAPAARRGPAGAGASCHDPGPRRGAHPSGWLGRPGLAALTRRVLRHPARTTVQSRRTPPRRVQDPKGKEPWCTVEGSLGSGRRADPHPDRAHPAAGRNPRRPRKPSRCTSTGGWSCPGCLRAGRRGAVGRRGCGRGGGAPASKPDRGMPAGCIPARQRTSSPRRSILVWVWCCTRPSPPPTELNTADLDAAERIVAERARSTGIAVVDA
jgi:hypothetical protein